MDLSEMIGMIYEGILQSMPLLRVVWIATAILGIAMLMIAFYLRKDPARKRSPWIVGGIALLMTISSGTQLIVSLL